MNKRTSILLNGFPSERIQVHNISALRHRYHKYTIGNIDYGFLKYCQQFIPFRNFHNHMLFLFAYFLFRQSSRECPGLWQYRHEVDFKALEFAWASSIMRVIRLPGWVVVKGVCVATEIEAGTGNFFRFLIDLEILFSDVSICVALLRIFEIWSWDGFSGGAGDAGEELLEPESEDSLEDGSWCGEEMLMSLTEVACFPAGSAIGVPVDNKLVNDANVRGLGLERNGGFLGRLLSSRLWYISYSKVLPGRLSFNEQKS